MRGGEGERRSLLVLQQVPGRVEKGREEGVKLLGDKECAFKHSAVNLEETTLTHLVFRLSLWSGWCLLGLCQY